MSDGVFITMELDVKPEAIDAFANSFKTMIGDTAKFKGFRSLQVLRQGTKMFLFEEWDSEADYGAYIAFRTERGDMDMLESIMNSVQSGVWPTLVASAKA
ncbi:antibiotic biosynthesis monooxygenase family protein [Rhizorhabdus argentea]|uniref:antibiotic biosynthesis monooxygenase family protein n=1 Tax=Rhizorhabdus argentea TaxID=1387174 RepID=UPI0030EE1C60